jgi:hypothetical protein
MPYSAAGRACGRCRFRSGRCAGRPACASAR